MKYRWLLFFYSISAKPVSGRIKIWRRLSGAGALQLKDAVYVLPYNAAHLEFFQWLSSEVVSLGGEALFVKAEKIEMLDDNAIIKLFNQHRKKDYAALERHIDEIEARLMPSLKDATAKKLTDKLHKRLKEFNEISKIDFFSADGQTLSLRLEALGDRLKGIMRLSGKSHDMPEIELRKIEDYQGKTWATRERPFVDRMSSAWLIKRFIDKSAVFKITAEGDTGNCGADTVFFDIMGGEFMHSGTMCTFEVMLKAFSIKDRALKKIAEIVHEIDIRDNQYENTESFGIEEILTGIQKTAGSDIDALERGAEIFELLYLSKTN
ncbi:chromate resistance protein ChrB domain-containing protein [Candidatus Magnetominusculus xianensis]|uniref:Chromate resistance protein n=1 Tax=Candidatus Magnetominusculus xianensis TaxID=1748249 RepID=A0ABR5SD55_9BACT|nr:chromate resistance protein ChrB domain-containing protein [Candidatus Magnetominusculus xianensis]KWT82779.1 chromate resistance protein [Candidatus Magnetominusculus xianensis]MBF0403468.1 chromate resistance protein [Nitrospirota bacterium]